MIADDNYEPHDAGELLLTALSMLRFCVSVSVSSSG